MFVVCLSRLEVIAIWLEAIASRLEAIALRLNTIAFQALAPLAPSDPNWSLTRLNTD